MYSKSNYRERSDIVIPENYSGNAFFGSSIPDPVEELPSVAEEADAPSGIKQSTAVSTTEPIKGKATQSSFLASLMPPKVSHASGLFNIGLEELLIIGVLILLSQGDSDDDILLLLFLLLFYK